MLTASLVFPGDNNVKVGIIFGGTGKGISEEEKLACHNAVDIYWLKSAWADIQVKLIGSTAL